MGLLTCPTMKKLLYFLLILWFSCPVAAQDLERYNRASIYPVYMLHPGARMYDEIYTTCLAMPVPDKYNDHRLSVRIVQGLSTKAKEKDVRAAAISFVEKNQIAKRMVAKWFERDKKTGECMTDLIVNRAAYSVSIREKMAANYTLSGKPVLPDADTELIPNTFVLISDISYIDKEEKAQMATAVFGMIGQAAQIAGGAAGIAGAGNNMGDLGNSIAQLGSSISDMVSGFTVDITTYLFQLKWNEDIANEFYLRYYCDSTSISPEKAKAFDADKSLFQLELLGSYTARSDKTVMRGINKPEDVFRKVLTRAVDKNIVELQHKYPQFKVTDVVSAILPDKQVEVQIGLKEGVNEKSKYEVLERVFTKEGKIHYNRKAVLKADPKNIWDNRCMAAEEEAVNAELGATRFNIISGDKSSIYPGMLVREMR